MAKLTAKERKKIPTTLFGLPKERKYAIEDEAHARDALSRASGKPEEKKVRTKVAKLYPGIKLDPSKLHSLGSMKKA